MLGGNGTIIMHGVLSYPGIRSKRIIVCMFVPPVGGGGHDQLCTKSPRRHLCSGTGHHQAPRCHRNWPLPGKFADSNSGGFFSSFPRCLQNPEWLLSDQYFLKVHYPKFEVSEDCLYLNLYAPASADSGSRLPVRLPALRGSRQRVRGLGPGRGAWACGTGPQAPLP